MRIRLIAALLICGLAPLGRIRAQGVDPNVLREVTAVRTEVARSNLALRQYTWTEYTEVRVKGDLKSTDAMVCRYDPSGELSKTPVDPDQQKQKSKAVSRKPRSRKKSDMQDYIERAISRIHVYVPPKPQQIDALLRDGYATLGQSDNGKPELRFKNYFEQGDSLAFTYDPGTKVVLRAKISSTLGSPEDPVSLEAVFEPLPDGINHLASTTLTAKKRKVEVKTRNVMYQRLPN